MVISINLKIFFFQAEDGIRDGRVTGVQTCALPIFGEELGHDEDLLGDLEALGLEREDVLARVPSPTGASLVGSQYYWILHYHPIAFLGFVALMEGFPPTPELIRTLIARTGHPADAFRTFADHGDLDPGHRDRLDRTLDSLPLTPQHEVVMGVSATSSAGLAAAVVQEVLGRGPHAD